MTEYQIPRVEQHHATVSQADPIPQIHWEELDNFDPSWLMAFVYIFGAAILIKFFVRVFTLYGACVVFWLLGIVFSYGIAGFMINPFYCILMSIVAGSVTWLVLVVVAELWTAPGRIWWKITR